ncbi:hypothetical protein G7Y89_g2861 [Cudoniella acicularis]|uniref:Poly [ADP-ribose] polymerase n=1 Tax=Cudoniella acicularis TaxID=354080 RepID=A0A8H4RUK3_9HELO|nr:hypothetical protein G7Y89_g2861 [Cudoniella acicularis]
MPPKVNEARREKTDNGAEATQTQVSVDEWFEDGGNVYVHIDGPKANKHTIIKTIYEIDGDIDNDSAAIENDHIRLLHLLTHLLVIEEWTSKYYSTIPRAFGENRPPILDNDGILRKEVTILNTLANMEVMNTIMRAADESKYSTFVNPLDSYFQRLGMKELKAVDHKSDEYKELQEYLLYSSAANHGVKFSLQDIFRLERAKEHEKFEKSINKIKDSNRLLLWHGSRTTNFAGILSQEAPDIAYPFGKGVHLAETSFKAARFCAASLSGGIGLILLVEADLGNPIHEIDSEDFNASELAKKHNCIATKVVGKLGYKTWKDAGSIHLALKGVKMPDGKLGNNHSYKRGYQFNEYISYHLEHLKLRYLFKVAMSEERAFM